MNKEIFIGVGITNATEGKILEYVVNSVQNTKENYYIVTPNPEMIVLASQNERFKTILNQARIALPDGVGLLWASKFLGHPLKARVSGSDFVDVLCKKIAEKPLTVGFLGGREGVAEETAKCLQKKYPGLQVLFASDEWSDSSVRLPRVASDVRRPLSENSTLTPSSLSERRLPKESETSKKDEQSAFNSLASGQAPSHKKSHNILISQYPNINALFVAFGFPKQEEWMASHIGKVPVKVMIGVGGAFDYISGRVPRAPLFIRKMGFEWLFRLAVQPWRLKRQLSLIEFMLLILKEKVKMLVAIRRG